jgi:hypothetical protein
MAKINSTQPKRILSRIRPHLVDLSSLLDQLELLQQDEVTICPQSDLQEERLCLLELIEDFGVTVSDFNPYLDDNRRLRELYNAIITIGEQLLTCFRNCGNLALTIDEAFRFIFPPITIGFNAQDDSEAETIPIRKNVEQPVSRFNPIREFIIELPPDFYSCVEPPPPVSVGQGTPTPIPTATPVRDPNDPCTPPLVYRPYRPDTFEALIGHECSAAGILDTPIVEYHNERETRKHGKTTHFYTRVQV